jgi:hypothetical protein
MPWSWNLIVVAVAGNTLYSLSASRWFESMDTSQMGLVWWEEVLDHMIEKTGSQFASDLANPLETHVDIFNMPHCKVIKRFSGLTKGFCYIKRKTSPSSG